MYVPGITGGLRHCRPASRGSTTSTARGAPGRAGARRPPPPCAARSSRPSDTGDDTIKIWGDGTQTRSFMYIDDCLEGIDQHHAQRESRHPDEPRHPARWSRSTSWSTSSRTSPASNCERTYNLDKPKGVRWSKQRQHHDQAILGWEPSTSTPRKVWRRPTRGSTSSTWRSTEGGSVRVKSPPAERTSKVAAPSLDFRRCDGIGGPP